MSRYKNIIFDVGSVLVNWMRIGELDAYEPLYHSFSWRQGEG